MPITIHDVAREAGTTIGTVSKALNNSYTISGEMTAHVKEVAERLGYRPNARAQMLARQTNREIAFLAALPRDIAFNNPHMFEILVGAESPLTAKGFSIKLYNCDADTVCHLAKDIMERKFADGLLLHASVVTRELSVLLTRTEIPHIVIGKPNFTNSLCWIDNNNQLAGELAADYLLRSGHQNLAFIGGLDNDKISQDRLEGIKTRLKEDNLVLDVDNVYSVESIVKNGAEATNTLVATGTMPDAIICANNLLAFGCMRALQQKNINIPGDVSLITFDDYPLAQLVSPALTTVSIDVYEMGVSAGKLLVNKIKKPELHVQTFTTMPRLIERESVRKTLSQ